jgi:hypothetical protein
VGFNYKRATALAANVAIVVSLVVNFGLRAFEIALPLGIDGGAFALLLSLFLFLTISRLSPPPRLDPAINSLMDL